MQFDDVPAFLLDRAIKTLEKIRADVDAEIGILRREKSSRDWSARHRDHMHRITADLLRAGKTDETQARLWLAEQGHSWKYAGEILSTMRTRIEGEKKAAREVEIFRRWNVGGEKKTALAREFGLSRASVERICKRLSESDGLKKHFSYVAAAREAEKHRKKKPPALERTPGAPREG